MALSRRIHCKSGWVRVDALDVPVRLNVSPRARRFTLRLDHQGDPVLTLPPGVPEIEAHGFLERHSGWVARAREGRPAAVLVGPGATIPIAGVATPIVAAPGPRRAPYLAESRLVLQGRRGDECPGARVRAYLRARAREILEPRARHHAARLGRPVVGVSLRDTRSRWGSCSSRGTLSFSWRLAMAPPAVADYVAAHEAAHLVEMNHGDRFWALVGSLIPQFESHRAWLRREGRALHAYRFDCPA